MKIRILLMTIGVAALAAITHNVNASDTLLTPRAAGNQIIVAPGTSDAQPAVVTQTATPRAAGNQTVTVNGTESAVTKCPIMGTPKSRSLAGDEARTSCCGRTLAACPNMSTCASAK
jgi:hypothetical protein